MSTTMDSFTVAPPSPVSLKSEVHDDYTMDDCHGVMTPTDSQRFSSQSMSPSPEAESPSSPSDDNSAGEKKTKKRRSWGQVLPTPTTNLPPRKRAKTEAEKEQRRVERVLRNRLAAQTSRERKRKEMEELEESKKRTDTENDDLRQRLSDVEAAFKQSQKECQELREALKQFMATGNVSLDFTTRPPTPPTTTFDFNAGSDSDFLNGTFSSNTIITPSTPLSNNTISPNQLQDNEYLSPASTCSSDFSSFELGMTQQPAALLCLGPQCLPVQTGKRTSSVWTWVLSLILSSLMTMFSAISISNPLTILEASSTITSIWMKVVSMTLLRSPVLNRSLPLATRSRNATGQEMREHRRRSGEVVSDSIDSVMKGKSEGQTVMVMKARNRSRREQHGMDSLERVRGTADKRPVSSLQGLRRTLVGWRI